MKSPCLVVAAALAACTSPTAPTSADLAPASAVIERPASMPAGNVPRIVEELDDVPMLLEAPVGLPLLPRCKVTQPDLTRATLLLQNVAPRVTAGTTLRFTVRASTKSWLQLGGLLVYRGATLTQVYTTTAKASAFLFSSDAVASAALQDAARSFGMAVTVSVNGTVMPECDPRPAKIKGHLTLNTKPKG